MDINTNNYWEKQNKIGQQEIAERAENIDKYGIHVPDDVYAEMNKVIANSDNPEESAYRFGTAYQYSQMFDIPFSEAYEKQDEFNHALYGAETNKSAKEWYTAVSDAFVMGKNNVRIGQLGNEIRAAMIDGDEEKLNLLYKELDILERDNETRQDNIPRMWTVEALKAGAESLPFTTASMVPGIIGSFISPGVGLTAGAVTSASLMSGQEYLELRKNGASHEVANVVANISGGLQGIVEVALGKSLETVGAVGGAVGKKVTGEGVRKQAIEKITNAVGKKLHYGAGAKIASNIALRSVEGTLEEGLEEAVQELISIGGQALAAELENYDLPPEVADNIGKQTFEAFKGGILGSLALGGLPVTINTVASVKDYQAIKKAAETIESPEMFKDVAKNSKEGKRVFSGFNDDKKDAVIDRVFKEAQTARDKNHDEMYAEQKESYTYDEETSYTDEEGNEVEIEVTPEYRTESGELKTDIQTTTDEDGNTKGTFRIVDENNIQSYGHIDYTLDEETQTVTIDNFKMANKNRDVLRAETFDAFAQNMAGYKIEWNPVYSKAKGFKEYLTKNNPYGEAQGLNYYKDVSAVADVKTRKSVDKQLQANIKNLTARERSAAIVLLESAALKKGLGLTEYVNQTFNNGQIFGNLEEAQAMAQKQNGADVKMQGAMLWRRFGAETRAVIYASEHSNFSTWAHELAHIWHDQLEGDLKTEAEKAFGVVNGDWRNTLFTFADGTVSTAAEAFARGFEDYLKTGKAPSNSLKKIFQDFAEFLARVYNGIKNFINMSPEITSVYDQLLKGDDSLLKLAEKAVIEQEIQNKLAQQRQQEEQAKQAREQQKEERAVKEREIEEAQEEYDETEQLEDETFEEETTVEEEEITDTVQEDIINSLDATNKEDAQKVADILTDENASKEAKETTALDSAGKNRDEEFAIFQLAGVNGIRNMAYSIKKKERLDALAVAQNMLEKASPLEGAKVTMQRIKWATGWDKNASGKWVYELDTSLFRIKNIGAFTKILQSEPQQLVRATDLTVDTILDAPELFEIYPLLRDIKVTFVNDYTGFRGGFGNNGIILNTRYIDKVNTEKGLKGVLVHEIQHAIQALEAAQSEDIKDKKDLVAIVENFRKVYAKLQQRQMNAGHFYDQDTDKFDASMQAYMNDELEIDARAVAKRTLLKSDERRHSIIANSTDVDITEKIVQQVIGIEGAQRLDDAYEVYERMDNYRIAREMELAGKSAKDIKLATGWERGVDAKWRYEIDDQEYKHDFINKSIDYIKNNPRYTELNNKLESLDGDYFKLTEAEQKEMDSIYDEIFDNYTTKNTVYLKDVLDAEELYNAYPEFKEYTVTFGYKPEHDYMGAFYEYREHIDINMAPLSGNQEEIFSILLHEIQHAIQYKENFARGGNEKVARRAALKSVEYSFEDKQKSNWYTYYLREASAADFVLQSKRIQKNPELIKKTGYWQAHSWAVPKKGTKEYNDYLYDRIAGWQEETQKYIIGDAYGYGSLLDSLYSKSEEELKKIRARNKYQANKYKDLYFKIYNLEKRKEEYSNLSDFELYKRLSGEAESRNVQNRMYMSPEQRKETLLSETMDIAPEDQIVLFQELVEAEDKAETILFQSIPIKKGLKKTKDIASYMKDKLSSYGFSLKEDYSGLSSSQYLTVTNYKEMTGQESQYNGGELKIRISDHDLPPSYDGLNGYHDIDVMSEAVERPGNDGKATSYENVIKDLVNNITEDNKEALRTKKGLLRSKNNQAKKQLPEWLLSEKTIRERLDKEEDINTRFLLSTFANFKQNERASKILEQIEYIKNNLDSSYYNSFKKLGLVDDSSLNNNLSSILNQSSPAEELENVRKQYENTDKWLKAPNGKDTNLTEKQWLQVRTSQFKAWFGDWENDPENASKVVDENGEPLVVYHGTLFSNFNVFDPSNGISFFTPTKEQAMSFGGRENAKYIYDEVTGNEDPGVFSCFLNIRNPKVVDFHGLTFNGENTETGESEDLFTDEEAFKAKDEGFDGTKFTNIHYDWSENFNIEVTDENIINDEFVVFSPNQIKSATDNSGEFSSDNPSILFQSLRDSEIDKQYFAAIEAGDMETVQRLVNEQAERKGYVDNSDYQGTSAFNGAAPYRNGYFDTKEERLQAIEEGSFEDTQTLGDFAYDNADALGFDYLINDNRAYRTADDKRKEAIENLRNAVKDAQSGKKNVKIKMYRSVPADIKENFFRVGDWITPSKSYAEDNADVHNWKEGEYRIIEQDVDLEHLWWDGNDIAEWGYDDETDNNRYKNVANNRKLAELITYDEQGNIIPLSKRFDESNPSILYQTAYHGSPHNFDRFTTDAIGTGEGAQSFGWGLYFTNQEDIARWYADKLSQGTVKKEYNSIKDYVLLLYRDVFIEKKDFIQEKNAIENSIKRELEAKKDMGYPSHVIADIENDLKLFSTISDEDSLYNIVEKKRNLYTVELPEGKYLYWDKAYEGNDYKLILEDIKQAIKNNPNSETEWALKVIDQTLYEGITGADLYHHLTSLIDDGEERNPEKTTSMLLKSIGYIGIDYPSASLSNMIIAEGKRNYVIFDDEDVKVLEHLTYQTLDELYTDARGFDSWQSFMEVYEGWLKPEPSLVPENADASWYKSIWEMAHGMVAEPDETLTKTDNPGAMSLDALFLMEIKKPGKLEEFLKNIHYLNTLNFDVMGEPIDEGDAAQREVQAQLQYFMRKSLTHGSWFGNAARVFNDKPLTDKARKTMLTLIEHSTRDYRDIYSELMGREDFAVPAEEKISTNIKLGLHGIEGANTDILSPEKRRQISEQIRNDEIAQKIKDGTMPMNDELDRYIKKLEKDTKEAEKKYDELKEATEQDYKRLSDWQQRQLIELQDEMLKARARYKNKSDEISRKINRGIKLTEQYLKEERALKASYDKLFKQYSDLIKAQRLNADINDAIERRENWYRVKEDLKEKRDEKRVIEQIKKLRIQLVKRTMRRVPFNRVDFKSAKTLIAIQRIFEPNLFGGVNKWIGTEGSYLRAVWSSWQTDSEFREKTEKRLQKYKSGAKVIELLNNSKTVEDFNKWTSKERARLHRLLPKEDWIRELKLEDLAEERADSIQLDITTKEDVKYDANGKAYILTTPVMSDEVKELVLDALGQDLFNQLVYRPFAEWTTEEMETLAKRVDEIYTDGKATLQAKKDAQIEQANRIRENIERAVKNTGIVINPGDSDEVKQKKREQIAKILGEDVSVKGTIDGKRDGLFGRLGKILHGYSDANVLRVARILDGYQDGTNVIQLYRRENDCYIAKNNAINQRTSKINQAMKDNKIKLNELFESVEIKDFYKGESVSFTVDELLFFMKASLDEKAKEAVMYGNMMSGSVMQKYKQEFINADEQAQTIDMVGEDLPGTHAYKEICEILFDKVLTAANSLDTKYLNFADAISDDYAIQFDRLQEASINEFNTPVWRENNYIPLVRLESNGDTNHNRVKEDLLGTLGSGTQTKQWADKGMTKKRIKISPLYQAPVETGLYKTWIDSVERTEHFIAYAGYVRELNRVYKSKDARFTRRFIEDRYGKGMVDYIDNYINEVANPNANAALSDMDRIVKILRGRTAPAYLAWKTSSIVKQSLTSPWPFIQFMNPAQYLKSCFDILTKKNMYETIQAKSVFMRNRKIDPIIDLIDEQLNKKTNPVMSKVNQFNKIGMTGLEMIDWVCVAPGWLAAYEERYKALTKKNDDVYEITKAQLQEENDKLDIVSSERMTEQQIETEAQKAVLTESEIEAKAVEYADDVVRQCQPSNRSVDLAPLFKQKGPGSEIIKAVLQFQTSLNVIWQNIRYDIPMAVRQKEFKKVVGTIGGYVMAGIMMNAVCEGFGGDDGEDEELTALKKLIFYSTTQFTDAIPVIGSYVTKTTEQLITGETPYSTNNDLFPLLTKYRQGTQQAIKGNWDKAAGKYAEALGLTFGAPVSGVKELLDVVSNEDGEDGLHFESLIGR